MGASSPNRGEFLSKKNEFPPPTMTEFLIFWWAPQKNHHTQHDLEPILEHQWSGRAAPEIIPKISTRSWTSPLKKKKGWKLNIVSKPWGFRQQFFRRKTCYIVFYSLWLHNQSCPVGNGRTTYKFYKAFGISYSQRSMKKAKILSRNPASSKPKRVFQCLTVDPRISH